MSIWLKGLWCREYVFNDIMRQPHSKKVYTKFRNKKSYIPNQTRLFLWFVLVLNFSSKNCNNSEAETGSERQYLIQRAELKLKSGTWISKIKRHNNVTRSDADRSGQWSLTV